MYKITALLSTILLFSFTTLASTTFKPNFKLKLDMSFVYFSNTVSDNLNLAQNNSGIYPSGGLHLLYNFKASQTFSVGFNTHRQLSDISLNMPNETPSEPDLDTYANYANYHILSIPISYTIDKRLSKRLTSFAEGGFAINLPTHSNYKYLEETLSKDTDIGIITDIKPHGIPITAFTKLGVKLIQKNGNFFKVGIIGHLPIHQVTLAEYDLNETHPAYPINGTIKSAFGYYGLSVNYAFSLARTIKEVHKVSKNISTFLDEQVNIIY